MFIYRNSLPMDNSVGISREYFIQNINTFPPVVFSPFEIQSYIVSPKALTYLPSEQVSLTWFIWEF